MKRYELSPEAARDIREIWAYIAGEDLRAARRFRLQLLDACRAIAANPGIGHSREDITDRSVLFWPVGFYLIIYDLRNKQVGIARVLHGARDLPGLL